MTYRNDVDGLRAIAVIAVILYHLGFTFIPGGFIGVDIFFVISGFLITQTIQKDILANKFTITHFYVKRIRRIVPALFVTTFATILFALLILPVNELKEFSLSVLSVSTFTSNIFFWQNLDYFSVAAELKPLLHTWSLGIEEQFYILFPIFMLLTKNLTSKKILYFILIFMFLSFTLSASPIGTNHISANFFLPVTRFWELFMGSAIALSINYISNNRRYLNNFLAVSGLLLILLPMVLLDQHSIFPGVNAFYPVAGTALIIYSGAEYKTFLSFFLSNKYIRYIGLISFSLYLWHWPIIALTKHIIIGELSIKVQLLILIITFILSALTYTFVEQPFRINQKLKDILQIKAGFITLTSLAVMAISIYVYIFIKIDYQEKNTPQMNTNCFKTKETLDSTKECSFGVKDSEKIFLLYGDSHSAAMYPVFEKLALENGWRGIPVSFPACAPLFDIYRLDGYASTTNCTGKYSKNVKEFLEENKENIEMVFLVSRWTIYEKGWYKNGRLQEKETHFISDKEIKSKNAADSSKVLQKAIIRTVDEISGKLNIPTVLLKPIPVLHANISRWLPNITKEEYLQQRHFIDNIFSSLVENPYIKILDPINIFCPTDTCKMYDDNGNALYKDDNHVNYEGSLSLYPLLYPSFQKERNDIR